jgi:dihydrolipoamide dehydrogenase
MSTNNYDIAIIGGGPGGYVAAIRAAQLGFSVVCIEREALGGICLNWGCIPTKALLKNAEVYRQLRDHGKQLGFLIQGLDFDFGTIVERSRSVAGKLSKGVDFLFRKNKIDYVPGNAFITRAGTVRVSGNDGREKAEIQAKRIIVATGARPRQLPFAPFDGERIVSYREAMVPKEVPKRLVIIGAGAIGVEFAYFYSAFGAEVTIVEAQPRLVPVEDAEISELLQKTFEKQGIRVLTSAKVSSVNKSTASIEITVDREKTSPEILQADKLLVAVGVQGNVENLGLEAAGVEVARGHIVVDASYRTTAPGIYAIGDVIGPPWLAHVASAEGVCCVERIAGLDRPDVPYASVPGCTYCQPEIASVGKTEAQLVADGVEYRVGRFPYRANGRALASAEETGLVKVLFGKKHGELLGAHIIGHSATEMIHEMVLAHTHEFTEAELLHTIHAHPTLSESIHEAVADAFGEAIHI